MYLINSQDKLWPLGDELNWIHVRVLQAILLVVMADCCTITPNGHQEIIDWKLGLFAIEIFTS